VYQKVFPLSLSKSKDSTPLEYGTGAPLPDPRRAVRSLVELDLQVNAGVVDFSADLDRLIARRKPGLAFTLGAMGSRQHNFYNEVYQRAGYAEMALQVQDLWLRRQREAAIALIPDDLVLKTNLIGTKEMVRELCWLRVACVGQNGPVRTTASVSCSLPIPQRKRTISSIDSHTFTKGHGHGAWDSHLHEAVERPVSSIAPPVLRRLDHPRHHLAPAGDADRPGP
jgi:hypothetical protein